MDIGTLTETRAHNEERRRIREQARRIREQETAAGAVQRFKRMGK